MIEQFSEAKNSFSVESARVGDVHAWEWGEIGCSFHTTHTNDSG